MATTPFANIYAPKARYACQAVLAQGRILRMQGLMKAQASPSLRAGFFRQRPPSACNYAALGRDSDSKPPS